MKIGERLKELRIEAGLTQLELAKKLNKSDGAVRMWELGKSEPDRETPRFSSFNRENNRFCR